MKVDLGPLVRFVEHLPKNGDVELSVLKCHLLVEEVLTKLIAGNLRHPEYLPNARLGFAQQMWLARASCDLEREAWVWEAVKRLNEARNALAHALDSEKIEKKLEACTSFVEAEQGTPDPEQITQAMGRFHVAAFNVF